MFVCRGHKKEVSTAAWHPVHEEVFASGGSDGSIMFWNVGADKEIGAIEAAHESIIWSLDWHPAGHILCSGSNDHNCKFWTRNRPGDSMRDKYNLNTNPIGFDVDDVATADASNTSEAVTSIPGMMDPEDISRSSSSRQDYSSVPPLQEEHSAVKVREHTPEEHHQHYNRGGGNKKTPYSKPIPQSFQASWNDMGSTPAALRPPPPGSISLMELQKSATAVVAFGNVFPVLAGSDLYMSIGQGENAVREVLRKESL